MEEFVKVALPGVDEEIIKRLIERLDEIGVLYLEDTKFVETSNINDILPPIQVKKLLNYFANKAKVDAAENIPTSNIETISPSSPNAQLEKTVLSRSTDCSNFIISRNDDWLSEFEVPWSMFPKQVLKACNEKTLITKSYKSEVVRILLNAILKVVPTPGRWHFRAVAKIVVEKYPATFQDRYEDTVIADGCTTLMKKLEDACDNKKRRNDIQDKFSLNDSSETSRKRKTIRNSYGCLNWQPTDLPDDETKESQREKKEFLIQEYMKEIKQKDLIVEAMKKTFASQRFAINNGITMENFKLEWPFLMEPEYLLNHYEMLMGHDLFALFSEEIPRKGNKIFNFMKTKRVSKILQCIKSIESWKEIQQNSRPEIIGSILLLMSYFNEDENVLFQIHNEVASVKEIEEKTSIMTPFIATLSESLFASQKFIVFCDGKSCIFTQNFISALSVLFAVYYVFNIEYPESAGVTLEFIQRLYAGINPSRGSKKGTNKKNPVHRKVLQLTEELKSFETIFKL